MDGELELDPLITHRLSLDQIDHGFDLMIKGKSLRSVVMFE
jgi:S-(hydroxymethyl)glutathione dehydrogenase/alcohol dehydrogenase